MKGIMFTDALRPLVQDGGKTQTRRVIKDMELGQYIKASLRNWHVCKGPPTESVRVVKPRYRPGETAYIKEPWTPAKWEPFTGGLLIRYDDGAERWVMPRGGYQTDTLGKPRYARCMPAWAARYFLRFLDVRAERVQDISEEDARAEGAEGGCLECGNESCCCDNPRPSYRDGFVWLWDSLAKPGSEWAANPLVWAYTFERCGQDGGR